MLRRTPRVLPRVPTARAALAAVGGLRLRPPASAAPSAVASSRSRASTTAAIEGHAPASAKKAEAPGQQPPADPSVCPFEAVLGRGGSCHRVFETSEALALLNTHPAAPVGAAVIMPARRVGHRSIFDMPDKEAACFVQHLPRLAKMVLAATEAQGVCCLPQADGDHPHVHVLPGAKADDDATTLAVPPVAFDGQGPGWDALAAKVRASDAVDAAK